MPTVVEPVRRKRLLPAFALVLGLTLGLGLGISAITVFLHVAETGFW